MGLLTAKLFGFQLPVSKMGGLLGGIITVKIRSAKWRYVSACSLKVRDAVRMSVTINMHVSF